MQDAVEQNKKISANNEKVRYLTYIESLLRSFRINWRGNKIKGVYAPALFDNFDKIMQATIDSLSMVPYIDAVPYEVCRITADIFVNNKGYNESRNIVYLKYCTLNPDKVLANMAPFVKEPFADSLLNAVAKNDPGQII